MTNTNADGSVNTAGAPASISLTGGDNGSGNPGTTDYTIVATAAGPVTFDWAYSTTDFLTDSSCSALPNNFCDPFSALLNGSPTILLDPLGGSTQNGTFNFNVLAGDSFGFRMATADNQFGSATTTISNFSAQGVPLETDALPVVGSVLFMAGGLWWKKKRNQTKVA